MCVARGPRSTATSSAGVVSGAGPSVLAFVRDGAGPTAEYVAAVAADTGESWHVLSLPVDTAGATLVPATAAAPQAG
jgi:homoserine kinase